MSQLKKLPLSKEELVKNMSKSVQYQDLLLSIRNRHIGAPVVTLEELNAQLDYSELEKMQNNNLITKRNRVIPVPKVVIDNYVQSSPKFEIIENYFSIPNVMERRRNAISPKRKSKRNEDYTFIKMLQNLKLKSSFLVFLKNQIIDYRFMFFEKVLYYRNQPSRELAYEICYEFLLKDSIHEIKLIKEDFIHSLREVYEFQSDLFDDLFQENLIHLENKYEKFLESNEFKEYLIAEKVVFVEGNYFVDKNENNIKLESYYPDKEYKPLNFDDKDLIEQNGLVKAATLDKLIEYLTRKNDNDILYAFLLTFKGFTNSKELLTKLEQRWFQKFPNEMKKDTMINHLDFIRVRIAHLLKMWIEKYPQDFSIDFGLHAFLQQMKISKGYDFAIMIEKALKKRLTGKRKSVAISQCPAPLISSSKSPSLMQRSLFDWPVAEIARQVTLYEYELFKKITPSVECMNQNWTRENRKTKAPNMNGMIDWFNNFSSWVSLQVLTPERSSERAKVMTKVIHLAEECRKLNNFNACFELTSCLTIKSIHRLKKTWKKLKKSDVLIFEELSKIISNKGNFKMLRSEISTCIPPLIPYLGIFLSDLTFIEDGNPDLFEGKIHFEKRFKIATLIRSLTTYQETSYPLILIEDVNNIFKVQVTKIEEKDLNDLSNKREPPQ